MLYYRLFIVICYPSIGALAVVKDSDAGAKAVMQGNIDTSGRLLRVAESGKQLFMFALTATYTTLLILYWVVWKAQYRWVQ